MDELSTDADAQKLNMEGVLYLLRIAIRDFVAMARHRHKNDARLRIAEKAIGGLMEVAEYKYRERLPDGHDRFDPDLRGLDLIKAGLKDFFTSQEFDVRKKGIRFLEESVGKFFLLR